MDAAGHWILSLVPGRLGGCGVVYAVGAEPRLCTVCDLSDCGGRGDARVDSPRGAVARTFIEFCWPDPRRLCPQDGEGPRSSRVRQLAFSRPTRFRGATSPESGNWRSWHR